jgi:hypothetical protein
MDGMITDRLIIVARELRPWELMPIVGRRRRSRCARRAAVRGPHAVNSYFGVRAHSKLNKKSKINEMKSVVIDLLVRIYTFMPYTHSLTPCLSTNALIHACISIRMMIK